jgi:hypothetical protein
LLARDCYFTAKEAKAGDPCVVEDFVEQTIEFEDDLVDGWDNDDDEFNPNVKMEDIDIV